jgi:outer membrane protein assembly factor BamE (lipoprotein component of BamABCDE complex)
MKLMTRIGFPLLALAFLSGCLVAHSSNQSYSGNYIPQDTFDRIQPGKTTAAWVQATLGEPSSRDKVDGATEVWKYSYTEKKESSGAIFLIFGGSDKKEQQHIAYVEMKDGVVSNKWRA